MPAGVAWPSQLMCSREKLLKSEFYADWVQPQEDVVAGGGALIFAAADRLIAFGGNIRRKDEEKLEARWLRTVDILVPHMRLAFDISRALAAKTVEAEALQTGSSLGNTAVLLLADNGFLLFANAFAEQMIREGHLLRDDMFGRVTFTDTLARGALDRCMRDMRQKLRPIALSRKLRDQNNEIEHTVRAVEYQPELHPTPMFNLAVTYWRSSLLITIDVVRNSVRAHAAFAQENGLTAAELSVAVALANGLSPTQIAEKRATSILTVRNQLRSAMSKAGVRRQIDLVRHIERSRFRHR